MISIVKYEPCMRGRWDEFVDSSRNGTFMLRRGYVEYHSDRFDDFSLVAVDGKGRWVGAMAANVADGTLYSHQGLTYGGWVLPANGADGAAMVEIFEETLRYLRGCGINRWIYKAIPDIYHKSPSQEDEYALFRSRATLKEVNLSSAVDLRSPICFNENSRRNAKKAEKAGLTVKECADYESYWAILSQVLAEKHGAKPVHSLAEIEILRCRFPHNIRLFAVFDDDWEMVAGTVIYETDTAAHAQYIASSEAGRSQGALALLFKELITRVYADKRYFDFGISNEESGRILNAGLLAQKFGFGGRGLAYKIYEMRLG